MSTFQLMLVGAFVIAAATASFGFQYQALFYLLLVIWGGFSNDNFFILTLIYLVLFALSGVLRISRSR